MTVHEMTRAVKGAIAERDRVRAAARAAYRRGVFDEAYWRLEQQLDRLEDRLRDLLEEYFAAVERVRAQPGGDEAIAFEGAARRWLARTPGASITLQRGGETIVLRDGERGAA